MCVSLYVCKHSNVCKLRSNHKFDFHYQSKHVCLPPCSHPEFGTQQMCRCCIHINTYSECFALGSSSRSTYEKSVSSAVLIVAMTTHAARGGVKSANLVMGPSPSGPFLKSSKHFWDMRPRCIPLFLLLNSSSRRRSIVFTY